MNGFPGSFWGFMLRSGGEASSSADLPKYVHQCAKMRLGTHAHIEIHKLASFFVSILSGLLLSGQAISQDLFCVYIYIYMRDLETMSEVQRPQRRKDPSLPVY